MALITLLKAQLAWGDLPLLDGADLAVEAGERIGLIGRNGTGKSSLLSVLSGRTALDDGERQIVDGLHWHYVEQEPLLPEATNIMESLCRRSELTAHHDERELWRIRARIAENLDFFGLSPEMNPRMASGGEWM